MSTRGLWYPTAAGVGCALLAWRLPTTTVSEALLLSAWIAFAIAGTLLAAVDLQVRRLPTPVLIGALTTVGFLVGAATATAGDLTIMRDAIGAGAALVLAYLMLALLLPGQIGMGDVRLAGLTGVLLGTQGWPAVMLGVGLPYAIVGPIVALQLLRGRMRRHSDLPFGPYMIIGAMASAVLPSVTAT